MVSKELLSEIHAHFRRRMNADVSGALRRHGVAYGVAFGVPSMQLREVAALYAPSAELAEALWAEDIRESKMLATRLYPPSAMDEATALRWVLSAPYDEVTDQLTMHLLSHLPEAERLMQHLAERPERMARYAALKLAARLDSRALDDAARAIAAAPEADMALRTAALLVLQ